VRPFLLGFLTPYLANFAWVEWHVGRWGVLRLSEHVTLVLMLVVIPLAAAGFAAALVQRRRPRRWLARPSPRPVLALLAGLLLGCCGLFCAAVATHFLAAWPESGILAATGFFVAMAGVWPMPCYRPGKCGVCLYNLAGSLDAGRCPECGTAIG
jgi:drug/metabolite transporter (DMT)-like permease